MFPLSFLCLLHTTIALAQTTRQQLSLDNPLSFSQSDTPPVLIIPNGNNLTVTVALCSEDVGGPGQRFFLTNASSNTPDIPGPGRSGGFEVTTSQGLGVFNGAFPGGGLLVVYGKGAFEVGVSDVGPIHELLAALPLLGDATSNQALLFSPPFAAAESATEPRFPNYALPQANISFPQPPNSPTPNFSLVLAPTNPQSGIRKLTDVSQTGCALKALATVNTSTIVNQTLWLRGTDGWRTQWLIDSLTPSTNYTVYAVQNNTKVSGPIYFATKSAAFPCSLVHSLSYCPAVAYSIPIPASLLPDNVTTFDSTTLPSGISDPLLASLTNFTANLLTFPCGRDMYSPIVTCKDCQVAYRRWLCAVSFVRCSEPNPQSPDNFTTPAPGIGPWPMGPNQQQPFSALSSVPSPTSSASSNPRNTNFPTFNTSYTTLLPCWETCTATQRACPPFMQFRCPLPKFNAVASYGVGYIDGFNGDEGEGVTGVAQDRWGNIWCNGV